MKRKNESEFLEILHEEIMDFHRSGYISDERMREFDELYLDAKNEIDGKAKKPPAKKPPAKEPATV